MWSPANASLRLSSSPIVFSTAGTLLGELPCLSWSVDRLKEPPPRVRFTAFTQELQEKRNTAEFVLARGREAEFDASRRVQSVNVSMRDFWERPLTGDLTRRAAAMPTLRYHSGLLSAWGEELSHDADGLLDHFSMHDAPRDIAAERWPRPTGPLVWMGHEGVVATPHYDLRRSGAASPGKKRWTLWRPDQLRVCGCTRRPTRRDVGLACPSLSRRRSAPLPAACLPGGGVGRRPPFRASVLDSRGRECNGCAVAVGDLAVVGRGRQCPHRMGLPFGRLAKTPRSRAMAIGRYLRSLVPAALGGESAPAFRVRLRAKACADRRGGRRRVVLATTRPATPARRRRWTSMMTRTTSLGATWSPPHARRCSLQGEGAVTSGAALSRGKEQDTERGTQPTEEEIRRAVSGAVERVDARRGCDARAG